MANEKHIKRIDTVSALTGLESQAQGRARQEIENSPITCPATELLPSTDGRRKAGLN